ncbi:reverse transcriptase domain-containing protein [Tanacetum coccineum]
MSTIAFWTDSQANFRSRLTHLIKRRLPSPALTGTFAYRRMSFGLCNAGYFQRCMVAIFHDMIEKTMEVFMDDFSVFGDSFSSFLSHLDKMLQRCEDTNLVLNWEKCHFMVKEGIVLGHKILKIQLGEVLGQRKDQALPVDTASVSKTIDWRPKAHYTQRKKNNLPWWYAFEKFRPISVLSKSTCIRTIRLSVLACVSKLFKPRLHRWILLGSKKLKSYPVKKEQKISSDDHLSMT